MLMTPANRVSFVGCAPRSRRSPTSDRICGGGSNNANRKKIHRGWKIALRDHPLQGERQRDPQSRRLGGVLARALYGSRALEPGRGRYPRPEIFQEGRSAGEGQEGRGKLGAVM